MLYKVGLCQFNPLFLEREKNLAKMESLVKNSNADLIVFPELATSGYVFKSQDEVEAVAEPLRGPTYEKMKKLAAKINSTLVIGFPEYDNGHIFNSAMMINPDGKVYSYRKIHLFFEEKKWFEPGNSGFKVYEAKHGIKVGLMVCFDWIYPESARALALMGAQIIAHPSNLVLPWCQQAMITRSIENRIFTITANRVGMEKNGNTELVFTGQSQVTIPDGTVLNRLDEEEETVYITEIIPNKANDKNVNEYNSLLDDRRKEFYL